eukprot:COSAG02_NODE_54821_length_294_cov_0.589744_1_plen_58_part_10
MMVAAGHGVHLAALLAEHPALGERRHSAPLQIGDVGEDDAEESEQEADSDSDAEEEQD